MKVEWEYGTILRPRRRSFSRPGEETRVMFLRQLTGRDRRDGALWFVGYNLSGNAMQQRIGYVGRTDNHAIAEWEPDA